MTEVNCFQIMRSCYLNRMSVSMHLSACVWRVADLSAESGIKGLLKGRSEVALKIFKVAILPGCGIK